MDEQVTLRVVAEAPTRADRYLYEQFAKRQGTGSLTRSQIKGIINEGRVRLDGRMIVKAGTMVKPGSLLMVEVPELQPTDLKPLKGIAIDIVHVDDHVIVLNKPPGLVVHPGAGNKDDTLVNVLIDIFGPEGLAPGGSDRPGIVHRLDQGTTGVMVVARTEAARQGLSKQFHDHTVTRRYRALVLSTPRGSRVVSREDSGTIDLPIGRHKHYRTLMAVRHDIGVQAVTHWERLELMQYAALLELRLETGRTHQIRVHMTHLGSPLLGDPTYGDFSFIPPELQRAAIGLGRPALHAMTLGFQHPITDEYMEFSRPVPEDMVELAEAFREFQP